MSDDFKPIWRMCRYYDMFDIKFIRVYIRWFILSNCLNLEISKTEASWCDSEGVFGRCNYTEEISPRYGQHCPMGYGTRMTVCGRNMSEYQYLSLSVFCIWSS